MKYLLLFSLSTVVLSCSYQVEKDNEVKLMSLNETKNANLTKYALKTAKQNFAPISGNKELELDHNKVKLGKALYFDKRLSKDGNISCNSCHNLETFGVDNLPTSPGDKQENGDRNSPTVFNAHEHIAQFWDGRAKTIEEQAGMPILNPVEMNIPSKKFLVDRLSQISVYQDLFAKAFPMSNQPITYENIQNSIGLFEKTLNTPSRFDAFLLGEEEALSNVEKQGLVLFVKTGCTSCHNGKLLGGNAYQKFGLLEDYTKYTQSTHIDEGRFNSTKNPADKNFFKVPSLRNISETHPYFHDGSVDELERAVWIMGKTQLGKDLAKDEVQSIVRFLEATKGTLPPGVATPPTEIAEHI